MTEALDRLKAALFDRYAIERELGEHDRPVALLREAFSRGLWYVDRDLHLQFLLPRDHPEFQELMRPKV